MNILNSEEDILNIINNNKMTVVYFTGMDCGACEAIKKKIELILKKLPLIASGEVNGEEDTALAIKYGVFSLPIFLLFVEGKETLRIGRNVNLLELESQIERYYNYINK